MVLGSNPKHTINDFLVKFCTIFVKFLEKRTKINNRGRVWPIFFQNYEIKFSLPWSSGFLSLKKTYSKAN